MRLLQHILSQDPATPRVTIYEEDAGNRLDFSAQTLDNWAAKVANMLREELDLEPGDPVSVDLPISWQAIAITLGCVAADLDIRCRQDVRDFLKSLEGASSRELSAATDGYHYHLVEAANTQRLDLIGRELEKAGFLAPLQPWEKEKTKET